MEKKTTCTKTGCEPAKALEFAEGIRKFEIELYWKRSAYFWTFIALAFTGYGALQLHNESNVTNDLDFLLANIGFVASVAWFLANRGSKYWQEQWETHIDTLEDHVFGSLYKKQFKRFPKCTSGCDPCRWIAGPCRFSVSKINQIGSFYVVCVWGVLLARSSPLKLFHLPKGWESLIFVVLTGVAILFFLCCGRTGTGCYDYEEKSRQVDPR